MFWMGKRKQGKFDLSPLEYMICLILFKHEKEELGRTGGSRAMSGYDIIAELNTIFEGIWEAQTGTMYPLLNKMASERHSGGRQILQSETKKSPLGPAKTVYELTEDAHAEIKVLLADNFENDVEFMERYLLLISQITDVQEYRPMILKYSEKLLKELRSKASSSETVELRKETLKKLRDFLQNTLQNITLDIEELDKNPPLPPPTPTTPPPAEEKIEEIKVCPSCGKETLSPEGRPAQYCSYCGAKF